MPTCANNLCHADMPGHARFCPRCGQRRVRRRKNFGWVAWLAIPAFFIVGHRLQSATSAPRMIREVEPNTRSIEPDFGRRTIGTPNRSGERWRSDRE